MTPQSSESKESEWTNVDKSESDDWEQEFDEITNETTKVKTPGSNLTKNNDFFRIKKKQKKKQKFKMKMKKRKRVTIGTTGHKKMTHLV